MSVADVDSLLEGMDLTVDNDEEDLSKLDRGDTVDDEDNDADKEQGNKDDKENGGAGGDGDDGKDKPGKGDKDKPGKEGKGEGKDGKEEDEEEDDGDDGDGNGDDDDDDDDDAADAVADKNTPARVRRAQRQRDAERQRAEMLQRELDAFKAGQKSAVPKDTGPSEVEKINKDLEALYEQVEEARADANTKEAARLQREIDAGNRRLSQIESDSQRRREAAEAAENRIYDSYLDRLETEFPELSNQSDDFDPAKVQRIMRGIERGIKSGLTPTQALVETADLVFGIDLTEPAKKAKPAKEAKKGAGEDAKAGKEAIVQKRRDKAKAADKQPADTSRRGADGAGDDTKIDVNRLSEADFEKLPESVKAKMRGDNL